MFNSSCVCLRATELIFIVTLFIELALCPSRGQVDPSVYVKAFQSCLGACNVPVAANEALVILTGGTPEAVVAGIAVGFKTIIYVASDDNEEPNHGRATPTAFLATF